MRTTFARSSLALVFFLAVTLGTQSDRCEHPTTGLRPAVPEGGGRTANSRWAHASRPPIDPFITRVGASLVRLHPDGSHDEAFTANLAGGFPAYRSIRRVLEQQDGGILLLGEFEQFGGRKVKNILRLGQDGKLDGDFSRRTLELFKREATNAFERSDGTFLIVGWYSNQQYHPQSQTAFESDVVILSPGGDLDPARSKRYGSTGVGIFASVLDAKGQLLLGGEFHSHARQQTVTRPLPHGGSATADEWVRIEVGNLIRFDREGRLDQMFNDRMKLLFPRNAGRVYGIHPQGEKLVVVSVAYRGARDPAGRIVRLNPNGTLDPGFSPGEFQGEPWVVSEDPSRALWVGGRFTALNGVPVGSLVKLSADGAIDRRFLKESRGGFRFGEIHALAVQRDGKILVGGRFAEYGGKGIGNGITRITPDGALDERFAGRITNGLNGKVTSIAVQRNGKILVAGEFTMETVPRNGFPFWRTCERSDDCVAVPSVCGEWDVVHKTYARAAREHYTRIQQAIDCDFLNRPKPAVECRQNQCGKR